MKRLASLLLMVLLIATPALASARSNNKVDPHRVRQELQQILSAREYDHTVRNNALDRLNANLGKIVWDAAIGAWQWVLKNLSLDGSSVGEVMATIGAWLVLAGFIVLLWYVARKLMSNYGGRKPADDEAGVEGYELPSARPLIKQAAMLAEQGDYKGAFRAAYVACIAYLDEIRALRFERSRTNWEYLRELKSGGHERPYDLLHPLTLSFDRKIYGRENCKREDYETVAAAYQRLSSEEAR